MEWFQETLHGSIRQTLKVQEVLHREKTEHQDLIIFRNPTFGRIMALDGIVQTTEGDEFIYHEMLAHVPILAQKAAKGAVGKVLIVGGGDGGCIREVLRHRDVPECVMVEIDASVIDMSRKHLPNHHAGAFDDPRARIVIADGARFVQETAERFDVVIIDSTDPVGPGKVLFTREFYAGCKRCLTPGGVLVTQNGVPFLQADAADLRLAVSAIGHAVVIDRARVAPGDVFRRHATFLRRHVRQDLLDRRLLSGAGEPLRVDVVAGALHVKAELNRPNGAVLSDDLLRKRQLRRGFEAETVAVAAPAKLRDGQLAGRVLVHHLGRPPFPTQKEPVC